MTEPRPGPAPENSVEKMRPGPAPVPENSMEEIMSSIRRAVAEDGRVGGATGGAAPVGDDDILELTQEVVDDDGPAGTAAAPGGGGLMSPQVAGASTDRFVALAAAVAMQRSARATEIGHRTVEEMVGDLMRPMIKEWLDANLPALVEQLVGREIDRMSRRAEDELRR